MDVDRRRERPPAPIGDDGEVEREGRVAQVGVASGRTLALPSRGRLDEVRSGIVGSPGLVEMADAVIAEVGGNSPLLWSRATFSAISLSEPTVRPDFTVRTNAGRSG